MDFGVLLIQQPGILQQPGQGKQHLLRGLLRSLFPDVLRLTVGRALLLERLLLRRLLLLSAGVAHLAAAGLGHRYITEQLLLCRLQLQLAGAACLAEIAIGHRYFTQPAIQTPAPLQRQHDPALPYHVLAQRLNGILHRLDHPPAKALPGRLLFSLVDTLRDTPLGQPLLLRLAEALVVPVEHCIDGLPVMTLKQVDPPSLQSGVPLLKDSLIALLQILPQRRLGDITLHHVGQALPDTLVQMAAEAKLLQNLPVVLGKAQDVGGQVGQTAALEVEHGQYRFHPGLILRESQGQKHLGAALAPPNPLLRRHRILLFALKVLTVGGGGIEGVHQVFLYLESVEGVKLQVVLHVLQGIGGADQKGLHVQVLGKELQPAPAALEFRPGGIGHAATVEQIGQALSSHQPPIPRGGLAAGQRPQPVHEGEHHQQGGHLPLEIAPPLLLLHAEHGLQKLTLVLPFGHLLIVLQLLIAQRSAPSVIEVPQPVVVHPDLPVSPLVEQPQHLTPQLLDHPVGGDEHGEQLPEGVIGLSPALLLGVFPPNRRLTPLQPRHTV